MAHDQEGAVFVFWVGFAVKDVAWFASRQLMVKHKRLEGLLTALLDCTVAFFINNRNHSV